MRYIKPFYFDEFQCAADRCPDTCCAGWQIMIDEETLENYQREKGTFAHRLFTGIDWREGSFLQHCGRCSMLNDNNLCDLVTQMGAEALCETCARYPRHVEEFEGLREWSLSLSCPIAAHTILECETPLCFVTEEDDREDPLEEEFEEFDLFLFTQLEDARKVLFQFVTDRNRPITERMRMILELAEEMQSLVDENRLYDMDNLIASYAKKGYDNIKGDTTFKENDREENLRFHELRKHFQVFRRLERLREEWSDVIGDAQHTLYADSESYRQIRQMFLAEFVHGKYGQQWERFQENILIFFLYTYFCGAVYDDWIYSKAALAVFSALFVEEFIMCKWFLTDKNIDWQECVKLAYRYAREVEHSDDNLNTLEEWLQENLYALKGTEH